MTAVARMEVIFLLSLQCPQPSKHEQLLKLSGLANLFNNNRKTFLLVLERQNSAHYNARLTKTF